MILVHIKTRLDLLGIQTFRWDQRLGRQYSNLNRHVSTQEQTKPEAIWYPIKHGVTIVVSYICDSRTGGVRDRTASDMIVVHTWGLERITNNVLYAFVQSSFDIIMQASR